MAFINPGFELPDANEYAGEALEWTWETHAHGEVWGMFNPIFPALWSSIERFEVGFSLTWDRTYADAATRLAAGPFVASEAGLVVRQEDTKAIWVLESAVPIIWTEMTTGIEDWTADLLNVSRIAARFNGGSLYDATIENFVIWDGPVWELDAAPPQSQDELGVGWRNTADTAALGGRNIPSVPRHPQALETFSAGWGMDPLAPVATVPGVGNGTLRSEALTFPLTLPPNQNRVWVWTQAADGLIELVIPSGVYATAVALAAAIQATWISALGSVLTVLEWRAWSADGATGIELGWDGARGLDRVALAVPTHRRSRDARSRLGLMGLSSAGTTGLVAVPYADFGGAGSFVALFDPHSMIDVRTEDTLDGSYCPLFGGGVMATFNTFDAGDLARIERFELVPWFGADAVWVTDLLSVPRVAAEFTIAGTGTTEIELFQEAATSWPDFYEP